MTWPVSSICMVATRGRMTSPRLAAVLHGVATPQMPQPMNIAMNRGQAELTP